MCSAPECPPLSHSLPGVKKALGQYGPAGVEDSTDSKANDDDDDDDDDIDLFGSDEEEVSTFGGWRGC